MNNSVNNLYEFGDYRLNAKEKNLWHRDKLVPLSPKVFETLLMLVEASGEVVEKDQMLTAIWPDAFVEESNLSQNIYVLRQVFGKDKKFIETVPKRGYRFVEPLRTPNESVPAAPVAPQQPEISLETKPINRRWRFALVGIGLISVILVTGYFYRQQASSPAGAGSGGTVQMRSLTDLGNASSPTISPDGRMVAFLDRSSGKQALKLMDVAAGSVVEVPIDGDQIPTALSFSPDGRELFFRQRGLWRSGQSVFRVSYFGGAPRLVAENVWGDFSVSPDGEKIAFFRENTDANTDCLHIKDLETSSEQILIELATPQKFYVLAPPAWSDDGKKLAVVMRPNSGSRSEITVVDGVTGQTETMRTELDKLFEIAWRPGGRSLLALSKEPEKGRQVFNVDYPAGTISRITNDLNLYEGLSLTSDGLQVVTEIRNLASNIWVLPIKDPSAGRALTSGNYGHYSIGDLKFATENRVIYDGRGEVERDLWATDIDTGRSTRLTKNNGARNMQITATSNGEHLYLASNRDGTESLWRMNQDGSNAVQITYAKDEVHWYPALSNDERYIYFLARRKGQNEIRRLLIEDGSSETIHVAKGFVPLHFFQTSPDGKYLAFAYRSNEELPSDPDDLANNPLKIGFLDLKDRTKITTFDLRSSRLLIRFTKGGEYFDYIREGTIVRQKISEPEAPAETVLSLPGERIFHFDWSLSETHIAVARGRQTSDIVLLTLPE